MKVFKILNFLLLLSILVVSSCNKDDELDSTPTSSGEITEVLITASISGTVMNEAGTPMEGVQVRVGVNNSTTDALGVFSFKNIEVNQNGAVVSVEKAGYFNSSKNVITNANKTSLTKIMLIEKVVTTTFDALVGGTSTTNGGTKVIFPSNAIKIEGGGPYSGNVNVYATYLDPTAADLALRMPGDLRATNSDGEDVMLETYGMIGVELESDGGIPLNIADGQTATIEIPVPASLLNSAPATIPLWHFDEVTGFWVEEGEATLNGDTYIGTVSHFSFWNFDVPYPLVHIEGSITDGGQNDVGGLSIQLTLNSNGEVGYGYTDEDGLYEGYVPKDEALTITILDGCWEEIYTGQIGPFSENAVVPSILVSDGNTNFITIIGVLHDCDDEIEPDGYVSVESGSFNNFIDVSSDGNFSGTISICSEMEVSISGVSNNPFSQGTTTVHDISGVSELNVGTLMTCW